VDNHTGPTHDMPDYVPNWPVVVKVKATVAKDFLGWTWIHDCPRKNGLTRAGVTHSQPAAFAAALKHARGCW
jgi:hypothetical protein